jgi:hypothetical protein
MKWYIFILTLPLNLRNVEAKPPVYESKTNINNRSLQGQSLTSTIHKVSPTCVTGNLALWHGVRGAVFCQPGPIGHRIPDVMEKNCGVTEKKSTPEAMPSPCNAAATSHREPKGWAPQAVPTLCEAHLMSCAAISHTSEGTL